MKLTHAEVSDYFIREYRELPNEKELNKLIDVISDDWYWKNKTLRKYFTTKQRLAILKNLSKDIYLYTANNINLMPYFEIVEKLKEVYIKKNTDYGDSFKKSLEVFGTVALRVRLYDKAMRLKTLLNSDNRQVKDETIEDTVMDFINYCIMGYMELFNLEDEQCGH